LGFAVTMVPPMKVNREVVSSTAIRKALVEGNLDKVRKLAGRAFTLRGKVVAGARRGKALGFPTANLEMDRQQALPPDGVYAGWACVNGNSHPAMTNVGTNPTFGDATRKVEVYMADFNGDLYGRELRVDFVARLRDEERFESSEALQRQMAEDVRRGKEILNHEGKNRS
jgi:riboflavin kinase/FMN adenylyltransferase